MFRIQSQTLQRLNVRHRIEDVPKDGNCFYEAFIRAAQLKNEWSSSTLREYVWSQMSDTEREISNAIDGTDRLTRFADEPQICVTVLVCGVGLYIINDDAGSIHLISSKSDKYIVMRLSKTHYQVIHLNEHSKRTIKNYVTGYHVVVPEPLAHSKRQSNGVLTMTLFLTSSLLLGHAIMITLNNN